MVYDHLNSSAIKKNNTAVNNKIPSTNVFVECESWTCPILSLDNSLYEISRLPDAFVFSGLFEIPRQQVLLEKGCFQWKKWAVHWVDR